MLVNRVVKVHEEALNDFTPHRQAAFIPEFFNYLMILVLIEFAIGYFRFTPNIMSPIGV